MALPRIDAAAIREGWDEALRAGVSIVDRLVVPSTLLKKLAALPRTNTLSRALREIGRVERTLFMTEWGVVQKCHFQVTPEIDRALMVRGFLVLGVTLI